MLLVVFALTGRKEKKKKKSRCSCYLQRMTTQPPPGDFITTQPPPGERFWMEQLAPSGRRSPMQPRLPGDFMTTQPPPGDFMTTQPPPGAGENDVSISWTVCCDEEEEEAGDVCFWRRYSHFLTWARDISKTRRA
jgi:hypothetical protein